MPVLGSNKREVLVSGGGGGTFQQPVRQRTFVMALVF